MRACVCACARVCVVSLCHAFGVCVEGGGGACACVCVCGFVFVCVHFKTNFRGPVSMLTIVRDLIFIRIQHFPPFMIRKRI